MKNLKIIFFHFLFEIKSMNILFILLKYMSDIKLFNRTAKHWVEEYANPERTLLKKVKELTDMGFSEQQVRDTLHKNNEDVEKALIDSSFFAIEITSLLILLKSFNEPIIDVIPISSIKTLFESYLL